MKYMGMQYYGICSFSPCYLCLKKEDKNTPKIDFVNILATIKMGTRMKIAEDLTISIHDF